VGAAATASAGLPIVFAPVTVDGLGPCIDGGTVNNTPMKWGWTAASAPRSMRSSWSPPRSHAQRDRVLGPTTELRGSAFSGFFDAAIRSEQLEAGFVRGQEVLRDLGWSS